MPGHYKKTANQSACTIVAAIGVVTKISSCPVNITSRWGIKQLRISSGSIFILFSNELPVATFILAVGPPPPPRLLMTALRNIKLVQDQLK